MKKSVIIIIGFLALVGIVLLITLVLCSEKSLSATEVGLDYDRTKIKINEKTLYTNGLHTIGVNHKFFKFGTQMQTIDLNSLAVRSYDGLRIYVTLSFQYRLKSDLSSILELFYNFKKNSYLDAYIKIATNAIRDVSAQYNCSYFYSQKSTIEDQYQIEVSNYLDSYGATVDSLQITEIKFPDNYNSLINEYQSSSYKLEQLNQNITNEEVIQEGKISKALLENEILLNNALVQVAAINTKASTEMYNIDQRLSLLSSFLTNMTSVLTDVKEIRNYMLVRNLYLQTQSSDKVIPFATSYPSTISCMLESGSTC